MAPSPSRATLANLVLAALRELGGSARIREVRAKVIELGDFTPQQLEAAGPLSSRSRSKISHGIDWAVQSLRAGGLIEHDGKRPATWSLTQRGRDSSEADVFEAMRAKSA